MGDKAAARDMAARAEYHSARLRWTRRGYEAARRAAEAIGYPLMIKAAAGGGGRGIRIADARGARNSNSAGKR